MYEMELDCRYDRRKSFYGKAHVQHYEDGSLALRSYTKIVLVIYEGNVIRTWAGYSDTTRRHINEFLIQQGYDNLTGKKEWDRMPSYYDHDWEDMTPQERREAVHDVMDRQVSEEEEQFWNSI